MNKAEVRITTGGQGGRSIGEFVLPEGSRISRIHVQAGRFVDGIQLDYETADGQISSSPWFGGKGGARQVFEIPQGEAVTGISGRSDWYVDSLQFHTTAGDSPVFGGKGGREFKMDLESRTLRGVFARADWYLDSFGLILGNQGVKPDNLLSLPGVGPKTARAFLEHGVYTFSALAAMSADEVRILLNGCGIRTRKGMPARWIEEARVRAGS